MSEQLKNTIYTLGYGGRYYEAALQQAENLAREGMIIDTRIVPHTKLVGFDQEDLQREKREHLPLSPELIAKINQGNINQQPPSVLKAKHVSILKRLAKSAPDIDLFVRVRNGRVQRIRHIIDDYSETTTEDTSSLEEE